MSVRLKRPLVRQAHTYHPQLVDMIVKTNMSTLCTPMRRAYKGGDITGHVRHQRDKQLRRWIAALKGHPLVIAESIRIYERPNLKGSTIATHSLAFRLNLDDTQLTADEAADQMHALLCMPRIRIIRDIEICTGVRPDTSLPVPEGRAGRLY